MTEPPPKDLPPGALLGCKNYEPGVWGGYRRVGGFERYDGRTKVSDAGFSAVKFTYTNATSFVVGELATFTGSGATGTIKAVYNAATAAVGVSGILMFFDGNGADAGITGTVADTDTISAPSTAAADADSAELSNVAPSTVLFGTWKNLAEDDYRDIVLTVPGSGSVKGVWIYKGKLYAFRANAAGTADVMYVALSTGWTEVSLGVKVYFDFGSVEISEDDLVVGASSSAISTVRRVVVRSGTWKTGDAEGYYVCQAVLGTYTSAEDLEINGNKVAEIPGIRIYFTVGETEIVEGNVVTGAGSAHASGAVATVVRVKRTSGDWGSKSAKGYFDVASVATGPYVQAEEIQVSAARVAETEGIRVYFTNGATQIAVADVVDGVTSGAQSTARRIVVSEGDWLPANDMTNGTFASDTGWTKGTGWTISGGNASSDGTQSADSDLTQTPGTALVEGKTYEVTFTISGYVAGTLKAVVGDTESGEASANGTYTILLAAGSGADVDFRADLDFVGNIDDVIVRRKQAVGYFLTDSVTSGPYSGSEQLDVSASKVADTRPTQAQVDTTAQEGTATAQVTQTLGIGIEYRFHNHNFGGHTKTYRMYGVNGADFAFEFDDSSTLVKGEEVTHGIFLQIETGMETDAPTHLEEFNNHLFLAFSGGSIQFSGYSEPLIFNPILGADEKNVGDEVTNMYGDRNNALYITTRNTTWVMYGNTRENFQLRKFTEDTGGMGSSLQRLGKIFYLDDRGATDLEATDRFGNYLANAISAVIDRRLTSRMRGAYAVATSISRRKQLIRWYFSDGVTVVLGVRGTKPVGFMEVQYGITVASATAEEWQYLTKTVQEERTFVGAADGYVYELDSGSNSFDGDPIEAFLRLSYHYSGQPDLNKKYRRADLDMDVEGDATIEVQADFNWGAKAGAIAEVLNVQAGIGFWGVDNWDEFVYDGKAFPRPGFEIAQTGESIGLHVFHSSEIESEHTLKGVTYQWTPLRVDRDTALNG